jgi:hypothetical protein
MRSRGCTKVSIWKIRVDIGVVSPIEQIEEFEPELEINPFRNLRIFVEIDVSLNEVRLPELHRFLIPAAGTERGNTEVALRNRSG